MLIDSSEATLVAQMLSKGKNPPATTQPSVPFLPSQIRVHSPKITMKPNLFFLNASLLLVALAGTLNAQQTQPANSYASPGQPLTHTGQPNALAEEPPPFIASASLHPLPADVVRNFINTEKKFRDTLIHFSFKRDVTLQTVGPDGNITGEYVRNSIFVLDDLGQRVERVVYHPGSTIKEMKITKEDVQDLAGSQLFGLETEKLAAADFAYDLSYVGEEMIAGRKAYLLAVSPKLEPNPHEMRTRFFVGHIWVDAVSFQTLKLRGITEPHGKQRFPMFETNRELRIEDHLFPSTTIADDVLHFPGQDVHYRVKVKYYDFKRFAARVNVVEVNE